jgi:putative ABC transport system substrate-binding protein
MPGTVITLRQLSSLFASVSISSVTVSIRSSSCQRRVDAVLTSDQVENFTHRRLIVELAETSRLPTMTPYIEFVEIGGLIAYAPDRKERFRYLASCVDKVLIGKILARFQSISRSRSTSPSISRLRKRSAS